MQMPKCDQRAVDSRPSVSRREPDPILQRGLAFAPWMQTESRRLPGTMPLRGRGWLTVDDAYGQQIALKEKLLKERHEDVHVLSEAARPAARELFEHVMSEIERMEGFSRSDDAITRPDGRRVRLDRDAPLVTLGRLVQEDLIILQRSGDEHILTGAILCFPASWTLREKYLKPLSLIHGPVRHYDADIARRVQRLFDALHPDRPLWRANALVYEDPRLFQPRAENAPRPEASHDAPYLRSERQTLLRLRETGAVVFSIHTTVVHRSSLTPEQAGTLRADLSERKGA